MEAYFSKDIVAELQKARAKKTSRKARFCIHVGGEVFPILRLMDDGFEVAAENTPHLRGLVDVFDGPSHLWQCLIVRADKGEVVTRYEYKRQTMADGSPPRDYAEDRERPVGYLSRD